MTHTFDIVNGLFEAWGGIAAWQNVRKLRQDRKVLGIDWRVTLFWVTWGVWNLIYYPSLHQWVSVAGGVLVVAANAAWLVLLWRITRFQRQFQAMDHSEPRVHSKPLVIIDVKTPILTDLERIAKSWADLKADLATRAPEITDYTLYWIDSEGDLVCRHCRASYEFGHFPGCRYDADWNTDTRTAHMRTRIDELARRINVLDGSTHG